MSKEEFDKKINLCKEMLEIQGRSGTFDYSEYFHGMYNGMEFIMSIMEEREPVFRSAPKKWLHEGKFKAFLRKVFRMPKHKLSRDKQGEG